MTQDIQFYQPVINLMIIIVGSDNTLMSVISRIVHGRDVMDIQVARNNHDAARMLAGSTFNSRQALYQTVNKSRMDFQMLLVIIFFNIAPGCLRGDGRNRTATADVIPAD